MNIKNEIEHMKERLAELEASIGKQKTPVDLSALIKSGIDCEVSDAKFANAVNTYPIRTLVSIGEKSLRYFVNTAVEYRFCRPRMNHWHVWMGGDCPLPEGLIVDVALRGGDALKEESPHLLRWEHHLDDRDIIAFRVVGLEEGYCWPWEVENE